MNELFRELDQGFGRVAKFLLVFLVGATRVAVWSLYLVPVGLLVGALWWLFTLIGRIS